MRSLFITTFPRKCVQSIYVAYAVILRQTRSTEFCLKSQIYTCMWCYTYLWIRFFEIWFLSVFNKISKSLLFSTCPTLVMFFFSPRVISLKYSEIDGNTSVHIVCAYSQKGNDAFQKRTRRRRWVMLLEKKKKNNNTFCRAECVCLMETNVVGLPLCTLRMPRHRDKIYLHAAGH